VGNGQINPLKKIKIYSLAFKRIIANYLHKIIKIPHTTQSQIRSPKSNK
jgi:hypothetical protein